MELTEKQKFWREHVIAWRASGKSSREYCEPLGLDRRHMGYYASYLSRKKKGVFKSSGDFVAIKEEKVSVDKVKILLPSGIELECSSGSEILRNLLAVCN